MQQLNKDTIRHFVQRSDELGGPGSAECGAFWAGLQYVPTTSLDKQVEPLSRAYCDQQMALYKEMTGHEYRELEHEFTPGIPVESLRDAPNAYGYMAPHEYARHCVAMGVLVQRLGLTAQDKVLELGSGWGFCQEFLAGCGLETRGIDVNPDFVATSNQRLERLGFGSRVEVLPFGAIGPHLGAFEVVMSYEAFHHSVDPLALLRKATTCLTPGGQIVLAAEPFNDFYRSWGLRLDPYSVYCISKFGWFESGWSAEYMSYLLAMVGLESEFIDLPLSDLSRYMIGFRTGAIRASQLGLWHPDVRSSVTRDGDGIFCTEDTKVLLTRVHGSSSYTLEFENFSRTPLTLQVESGSQQQVLTKPSGTFELTVDLPYSNDDHGHWLRLKSETFCPAEQGINDDQRSLGLHLSKVRIGSI